MPKIKITQVKSGIDRPQRQRLTLQSLGLGKVNRSVVHDVNPQIIGMVRAVSHLVKVEEV